MVLARAFERKDRVMVELGDNVLAVGSNHTAWNKNKWKQTEQWHKFFELIAGIPPGLDENENGRTKHIVVVKNASPLYNEGKELPTNKEQMWIILKR